MVRSRSSSHVASVGALAIVGVTRAVDAQHDAGLLEPEEQVVERGRGPGCLHHVGDHAEVDRGIRLDHRPVQHPRVARPHPADRVGVHPTREQPDARVGRGLARPDDDVLARRLLQPGEVVDRYHPRAVGDPERWRRLRGDVGREVAGVDDPAPLGHLEPLTRDARDDGAVAEVVAAGEELDPARLHHPVEHPRVVGADLRLVGPLVQALLGSALLQLPAAEHGRGDAVEGRGLVQPHERVRLEPVAADAVATVDQRHAYVGVVDQRVGEGHAHRTGTDHEVVGVDGARHAVHGGTSSSPRPHIGKGPDQGDRGRAPTAIR